MKKIILSAALIAVTVVSCKKDRTCECTNKVKSMTSTEPGFIYEPEPATTSKATYKNVKKSNINIEACVSAEYQDEYNYTSWDSLGNNKTYKVTTVYESDCSIK
jgi:hypothetical protein